MHRLVLPLVFLIAGCTTSPLTGRSQYMLVSEAMAVSESAAAYNQMMGELGKKQKIETGTPRALKVQEITDRLVKQAVRVRPDSASWKWEVKVIDDPKTVNAFCMAGGKMAIYTGMWEQLHATDDEVAQVMDEERLEGPTGQQPSSARDGLFMGASDTFMAALREEGESAHGSAGGDGLGEAG